MPASMLTVKKGMPAQTLTAMTDAMAKSGSASQDAGRSRMPKPKQDRIESAKERIKDGAPGQGLDDRRDNPRQEDQTGQ